MYDAYDMERRDFRGGAILWRQPTILGESACLRPESLGVRQEEGLGSEGKGIDNGIEGG